MREHTQVVHYRFRTSEGNRTSFLVMLKMPGKLLENPVAWDSLLDGEIGISVPY